MDTKESITIAAIAAGGLLMVILILGLTLGLSWTFFLISGIDLVVILAVFIFVLLVRCITHRPRRMSSMRRRSLETGEVLRLEYSYLRKVAGLPAKFSYKSIEAATDSFQALLGRGSSASVFKGILDDGTPVAVKRIEGGNYAEREFRSEVSAIGSVQHINLVRLLGYCLVPGSGPRFLVYEFVHNGSLDSWIFPSGKERGCLPWSLRYRVAIDVAKALAYLHHDCRSKVLHMDVKPENILLDEGFRAYVSDFGLSKLLGKDESRVLTTIRGTRGYLAPEWILESGVSEKCDVYSYGMVVLEMVGGRRSTMLVGEGERSARKWSILPRIAMEKAREGRVIEVVDERLGDVDEGEVKRLVNVGLWCIQERSQLRPSMARVVDMLEGRMAVEVPPETETRILDLLSDDDHVLNSGPERICGIVPLENCQQAMSICSPAMSSLSGR